MALNHSSAAVFIYSLLILSITLSIDAQENLGAPTSSTSWTSYNPETETTVLLEPTAAKEEVQLTEAEKQVKIKKVEKKMMMSISKTEEILNVIKKRLEAKDEESDAEGCLNVCMEVYDTALDYMKNSIEDVGSGDYYNVYMDVSAVSTFVSTCEDCYNEMLAEDPVLEKFDVWVHGVTSECLDDLVKVTGVTP